MLTRGITIAAVLLTGASALGAIDIELNYSLDTNGFFRTRQRRDALEYAAATLERHLDELLPIVPSGGNTWRAVFVH
ncbi:MAG: peptidase M10A and M12B matrixin and adamalysin, partial [Planctomycetota bacterium]